MKEVSVQYSGRSLVPSCHKPICCRNDYLFLPAQDRYLMTELGKEPEILAPCPVCESAGEPEGEEWTHSRVLPDSMKFPAGLVHSLTKEMQRRGPI